MGAKIAFVAPTSYLNKRPWRREINKGTLFKYRLEPTLLVHIFSVKTVIFEDTFEILIFVISPVSQSIYRRNTKVYELSHLSQTFSFLKKGPYSVILLNIVRIIHWQRKAMDDDALSLRVLLSTQLKVAKRKFTR